MTLRPGEVVLIRIDFHQTPGGKLRPAVVLLDSADDDSLPLPSPPVSEFPTSISLFTNGATPV